MASPMQASGGRRAVFRRRTDSALATSKSGAFAETTSIERGYKYDECDCWRGRLDVDMSKEMHAYSLPSPDNEPINANHCYLVGRKLPMRGASHCGASVKH
jgi:hypothetical protein